MLQEECKIEDKLANEIQFGRGNQKSSLLMSLDWFSNSYDEGKKFKLNLEELVVGAAQHWQYQGPTDWLWLHRSSLPFLYALKYNCCLRVVQTDIYVLWYMLMADLWSHSKGSLGHGLTRMLFRYSKFQQSTALKNFKYETVSSFPSVRDLNVPQFWQERDYNNLFSFSPYWRKLQKELGKEMKSLFKMTENEPCSQSQN